MQLSPRNRLLLAGAGVVLLVVLVVGGVLLAGSGNAGASPTPSPTESPSPTASPSPSPSPTASPSPSPSPVAYCPYNGQPLDDPSVLEDRPAMLVQVENNPVGRPTSGLNAADLVIEAPVEGDTTRFGPVYLCSEAPAAIGPVRSARYYDVDLWRQLHAMIMHFGAGYAVLQEFDRTGMPYVNGISGGWSFFARSGSKPAPHNVYFDLAAAREAAAAGRFGNRVDRAGEPRAPFEFEDGVTLPRGRDVGAVTIRTASIWVFGWSWDSADERWLRSDGGARATDALTGEPLFATSVVVQKVTEDILSGELDPGGYPRRRQHLVGSGTGVLYLGGQAHDVRWSRPSDDAVTSWTYADSGEPVVLPPGKVWWEIVPVGSTISER